MERNTTKIALPPRHQIQNRGPKVPRWGWVLLIFVSLLLGAGGGLYMGLKQDRSSEVDPKTAVTANPEITRTIAEARVAIAAGDWLEARRLFEKVRDMDPKNPDALASLPLIDRRLDEARGSVKVETVPEGAIVSLRGIGKETTPAILTGIPFGTYDVEISREGFETVVREVEVYSEEPILLPNIELVKTSGGIDVVSEPVGAEFKVIKTKEKEAEELVKIGTTPARIEKLDPGEYRVLMAVEGWPEYSASVRVENNRNTSVSAVFAKGGLNLTSDPIGAEVWIQSGDGNAKKAGKTPVSLSDLPVGKHRIELRYQDWNPIARTVEVTEGMTQDLAFSWERTLVSFESSPAGAAVFSGNKRIGDGRQTTPFRAELPKGDYVFSARYDSLAEVSREAYVDPSAGSNEVKFSFAYGSVALKSEPTGATVLSNGVPIGKTPLNLAVVSPGTYSYELSKDQHRSTTVSGRVEAGGSLNFTATLTYDAAPAMNRNFTNGLGQRLNWVGALGGWVGVHEVTQAEYEKIAGSNPSYFPAANHPVETVTWYDAVKYCDSLTLREKAQGNLPEGYRYRLPTDAEWTRFAGQQKLDGAISSLFERKKSTAAVGSLEANEYGLHDVRGNVWEWVSDWYSQTIVNRMRKGGATPNTEWVGTDRKVLRGGAWNRSSQYDLAIENRMAARPSAEDRYDVGFRVVLMPAE